MYRFALIWWAMNQTGSAFETSAILFCSILPMLLFVLIGGVAVDRFPRVPIMLASDVIRGSVVLVVALLFSQGTLQIWHVYAASVIFGSVDAFFQPAYTALLPEITPQELLPSANSLTIISQRSAGVIGPLIATSLVATTGTTTVFALNGLSFFLSALCLLPLLRRSTTPPAAEPGSNIWREVREGLSTVKGTPWLWITIAIVALGNITSSGPLMIALPFLVKENHAGEIDTFGLARSMLSLGVVIGAVWLGRKKVIRRRGLTAYGAWLISGLLIFTFGLPIGTLGMAVAGLIIGLTTGDLDQHAATARAARHAWPRIKHRLPGHISAAAGWFCCRRLGHGPAGRGHSFYDRRHPDDGAGRAWPAPSRDSPARLADPAMPRSSRAAP
jgi:DHA3 family tetracycline resistance protein-like MFS transporter